MQQGMSQSASIARRTWSMQGVKLLCSFFKDIVHSSPYSCYHENSCFGCSHSAHQWDPLRASVAMELYWPRQTAWGPRGILLDVARWLLLTRTVSVMYNVKKELGLLKSLTGVGRICLTIRRVGVVVMRTKCACLVAARRGLFKRIHTQRFVRVGRGGGIRSWVMSVVVLHG
jgi:hypothetical protein